MYVAPKRAVKDYDEAWCYKYLAPKRSEERLDIRRFFT